MLNRHIPRAAPARLLELRKQCTSDDELNMFTKYECLLEYNIMINIVLRLIYKTVPCLKRNDSSLQSVKI